MGIPVTTAERAIGDVHAAHIGPAPVGQAITGGRRTTPATMLNPEALNAYYPRSVESLHSRLCSSARVMRLNANVMATVSSVP